MYYLRPQDILVSLLRTEGVLSRMDEEEKVHHNFALVERWREVSKVGCSVSAKQSDTLSQCSILAR